MLAPSSKRTEAESSSEGVAALKQPPDSRYSLPAPGKASATIMRHTWRRSARPQRLAAGTKPPAHYERRFLGDVPPDQQGSSERQFTCDPAVGCIIGKVRSWGPKLPFVIQASGGPKLLVQVTVHSRGPLPSGRSRSPRQSPVFGDVVLLVSAI